MVIWRGYGWAILVIVLAAIIVTQEGVNSIYGNGYYKANEWPKILAILSGAVSIGILGYFLNYKNRTPDSPSHSLFFIPIEYWVIIVPVFFFWMENVSAEKDAKEVAYLSSPAVNDMYFVDFTKIFEEADKEFKYGVMKVSTVTANDLEVVISELVYDQKSGPRKDKREGKLSSSSYFTEETSTFSKDELLYLKEIDAIYSVSRK